MGGQGCVVGGGWGGGSTSKQTTTMPDMAVGWVCSLLCMLGGIWGRKLYILGVAGFITPIWDALALKGEREEAGEHIDSPKLLKVLPN